MHAIRQIKCPWTKYSTSDKIASVCQKRTLRALNNDVQHTCRRIIMHAVHSDSDE